MSSRAPFIMVFDDSCPSHRDIVIPALVERGLTGTFYIVPGSKWYDAGYWSSIVGTAGVVLANHTFTHAGSSSVEEAEGDILRAQRFLDALEDPGRAKGSVVDPASPQFEVDAVSGLVGSVGETAVPATAGLTGEGRPAKLRSFCIPGGVPWTPTAEETAGLMERHHLVHRPRTANYRADTMSEEELLATPDRALRGEVAGAGSVDPNRPYPEMVNLPGYLMFHGVGGDWLTVPKDRFLRLLDRLVGLKDRLWVTDPISWHTQLHLTRS